jgi:TolB-like protein/Flp pilus assembly protein TadD
MSSLVPGYEYDVFISYRQKDNQYDGWVTEFVNNLKKELAATFKEDVSVYFDENPHDGLLETHHVNESLREKLKCLVFIPVISKTYCDAKCYAWNQEFLPFLKLAAEDRLGMMVRLANGNVASRVVPVCIHEIEMADQALLEKELGHLRSIDFIFKAPGVNRPLRDREERPFDNHKPIFYRNQINKLANAILEIISTLNGQPSSPVASLTGKEAMANTKSQQKSIAVLPFVNMSKDEDQEYFSDGISEEIINMLVKIPALNVAGRTSSFSFKNKNEDIRMIAEKLSVDYVLEGSVRKSGNLIRITVQLIEATTGYHHWSEKYDRELHDVFAIQDEIAKAIADKLKITFSDQVGKPIERVQTHNVEAYQLYLKGRSLYYKRGIEMFEALRCFEAALKVDPNYALAWAGLTDTYSMLCFHSFISPEEVWPKALQAVKRAQETGPNLAETYGALGTIALLYERNWGKAERDYLKALELNPNYMQARTWYGLFYLQGIRVNHVAALEQAKISIDNDPLSAYAHTILALVSTRSGNGDGLGSALKAVAFQPDAFLPWYILGNCYHWSGHFKKATGAFNHALEISGRHAWALTSLLVNYVDAQQMKEAEIIYHEMLLRSRTGHILPSLLAMASAAVGKNEDAIRYAYEAYDRHDAFQVQCVNIWPDNKYLMAIPEYSKFLEKFELN